MAVGNIILRDCICLLVTYLDLSRKSSKTAAPNLFFIRDWFCGRLFFHGVGLAWGWVQDDSCTLHLLCTFFLSFFSLFIFGCAGCLLLYRRGNSLGAWASLCDSGTVGCQAPLSVGFPRQGYWSGLPFPFPRDLPYPRIEPHLWHPLHWQANSLPLY